MTTELKYAVYDAKSGQNTYCNTKEDAISIFINNLIQFATSHFYDTPFAIVQTNEDGSETWKGFDEKEMKREFLNSEIEKAVREKFLTKSELTKVEKMP